MLYTLVAIVIGVVALFVAYKSVRILIVSPWLAGFFRGLFGLALLGVALVIAVMGLDVYSYKQASQEQVVATITFDQIEEQHFDTVLTTAEGISTHYDLRGDQWQVDARVIKWKGYIGSLGVKPAFRLDRLSGRYFDIEQETTAKRTAYSLSPNLYGWDFWLFLNKHPEWALPVDARYGSATYLPIKDKAAFEISLSATGLLARPLNDVAKDAVEEFK